MLLSCCGIAALQTLRVLDRCKKQGLMGNCSRHLHCSCAAMHLKPQQSSSSAY